MVDNSPRVFISYSWSSEAHKQWVLDLATELRGSYVDVVLDQWDLKEGHDAHAFMEQMVTDPEISKVIVVCDKNYVQKSERRAGGVGTEAQIMTPEIYGKQKQEKFVAVVTEKDDEGNFCLPVYLRGRIFIDFCDDGYFSERFEQLVRWIFDKPLRVKPPLGQVPEFLKDVTVPRIGSNIYYRRALEALRDGKQNAIGLASDYFMDFCDEFEKTRIPLSGSIATEILEEKVFEKINSTKFYRDELVSISFLLSRFAGDDDVIRIYVRLMERLQSYCLDPENVSFHVDWALGHYQFFCNEMFLIIVASLVRHERFVAMGGVVDAVYYVQVPGSERGRSQSFVEFREPVQALEQRNRRLNLRRTSLHADLIKDRCTTGIVKFSEIMQADFVLFLKASFQEKHWRPNTLLYCSHFHGPFEIFARSMSQKYFQKLGKFFNVASGDEFRAKINWLTTDPSYRLPRWNHFYLPVAEASGAMNIGTRP